MKIITLHCDYIKFKPIKKAINSAEHLASQEEVEVKDNPLVVLTAVEYSDSTKELTELIEAVSKTANEVKTKTIVLYPYAHLSPNLAPPDKALEILKQAETSLAKQFKVTRAPFGYYKQFELKCKGHPLSELSKQFSSVTPTKVIKGKEDTNQEPKKLLREISRSKLDTSKLKDNDHRILGQRMDLFSFNEVQVLQSVESVRRSMPVPYPRLRDQATTIIHIRTADKDHEARYAGVIPYANVYPPSNPSHSSPSFKRG